MDTIKKHLFIQQRDSQIYKLLFTDSCGAPIDITDWTIYFTVKRNLGEPDSQAIIRKDITTHTDPTGGETKIQLSCTDTDHYGNYIFDIQYKKSNGIIKTIMQGLVTFSQDVTRRT